LEVQNLIKKLTKISENISLKYSQIGSTANYKVSGWNNISNHLNMAKELKFLDHQVNRIFSIDQCALIRTDEWANNQEIIFRLQSELLTLISDCISCINLLKELYKVSDLNDDEGIIYIKIPNDVGVDGLSSICKQLHFILSKCPFIKEEVKLIGAEDGSVKLKLIAGIATISILSNLVNISMDIERKQYENQITRLKLEEMKAVQGILVDSALEHLESELNEYYTTKAKLIDGAEKLEPEDFTRLVKSIEYTVDMVQHGVQIQATLGTITAENIDVKFPASEDYKQLTNSLKLIE